MINPSLSWLKPQLLKSYPYTPALESIPKKPGLYIFYRTHGRRYEIFYVGRAANLRARIKSQLNNLKLMNGIRDAANGTRLLAYAEARIKPGQNSAGVIAVAERMLIRHFVDEGHELLNVQGTKIRLQTLESQRPPQLKAMIPVRLQSEA